MTRRRRKIHDFGLIGMIASLAAALAGCASAPPPVQLLDRTQSEIRAARNAGAATTAPDALAEAERRLAAAQQFVASNDNDKATDKAEEAEAAAATARARADLAQLNQEIRQQTEVNAGLKADLERRQAAAAAAQQAVLAPPVPASTAAAPAAAASSGAAVTLPSVRLGQPATPASTGSAPASAGSAGGPAAGLQP